MKQIINKIKNEDATKDLPGKTLIELIRAFNEIADVYCRSKTTRILSLPTAELNAVGRAFPCGEKQRVLVFKVSS